MLPKDPFILLSYLNTKLRDEYSSLDELCDDLDASAEELREEMERVGFRYDPEQNRFL